MIFVLTREMENISRDPTFGDFVAILRDGTMQDINFQDYTLQEFSLSCPPPLY